MNKYVKELERIEFVVTLACTGRCKHCSEGNHTNCGEHIDGDIAADAVCKIASVYDIKSLMTFGGEPLLYADEVYKIHDAARKSGIAKRQLITNGYFSRNTDKINFVVEKLADSGVNEILLSVDAFHQETIPLEPVKVFAQACIDARLRLRVHPAWLVSSDDVNSYNEKTREILSEFTDMGIEINDGNVIFPSGNALKYLSEYFNTDKEYSNPYVEDPADIKAICIGPNGDVLGGNINKEDIMDILCRYSPEND